MCFADNEPRTPKKTRTPQKQRTRRDPSIHTPVTRSAVKSAERLRRKTLSPRESTHLVQPAINRRCGPINCRCGAIYSRFQSKNYRRRQRRFVAPQRRFVGPQRRLTQLWAGGIKHCTVLTEQCLFVLLVNRAGEEEAAEGSEQSPQQSSRGSCTKNRDT